MVFNATFNNTSVIWAVSHIPEAVHFLVTPQSLEAEAPEVNIALILVQ
jgi:hypothetical protein